MANVSLFISSDYIKETTGMNDAISGKKLQASIIDVQRRYIEPILGTDLYNAINDKIAASTLTGNYQTLVNTWVAPVIAWYTYAVLIPEYAVRLDRGGVYRSQAENSSAASRTEVDYLQSKQFQKAEQYAQRLVDYLCNQSDLFPEYTTNSDEDLRPTKPNVFDTFGLDNVNYDREWREKWGYGQS